MPELHLDAAVERATLRGVVRGEGSRGAAAVALHRSGRQAQCLLHREGGSMRARLRQGNRIAIDARVAIRKAMSSA